METWVRTSLILCVFGFLKEFRPSEPFITPYLTQFKNFTNDEHPLMQDIQDLLVRLQDSSTNVTFLWIPDHIGISGIKNLDHAAKEAVHLQPGTIGVLPNDCHAHIFSEVNQEIYPIGTYSYLSVLVLVFLVTDLLRYKPVIILLGLSGIVTWSLLVWGTNIAAMQAVEFSYGVFMATEVAYFTYIYAQVERQHYQRVTSHARTAFLLGRFLSGGVSQALVSSSASTYYELNFVTLAGFTSSLLLHLKLEDLLEKRPLLTRHTAVEHLIVASRPPDKAEVRQKCACQEKRAPYDTECVATLWAFLLPPVQHSLYFHRGADGPTGIDNQAATVPPGPLSDSAYAVQEGSKSSGLVQMFLMACSYLWRDFKQAFTNRYVVRWSIWWALATCGFLQGTTYIQMLWETIAEDERCSGCDKPQLYNGAIEAAYTLIGAAAALACGWLQLDWRLFGEAALALCSLLQGATLLISSLSTSLWLAYCMYIVFGVLYHTMITIANSEVAKYINEDSYGLIFGANTFFALVFQTILTAVVVGESGLALGTRMQYKVYGSYFLVMGAVFLLMVTYTLCSQCLRCAPEPALQPKAGSL